MRQELISDDIAVLVVGYQRPREIRLILNQVSNAGINSVYLSIDAPRVSSADAISRYEEIRQLAEEFEGKFDKFFVRYLLENVGCAANILSACDWAFATENKLIILEDDCIPNGDFFLYVDLALKKLSEDQEVLLVCGTQFNPSDKNDSFIVKSRYSLTWGWATTKNNWSLLRKCFTQDSKSFKLNLITPDYEKIYWSEGARRAINGYVDVWDTVLVNNLVKLRGYAYLPSQNLVKNVGNDAVATHTGMDENWVNTDTGSFKPELDTKVVLGTENDLWLKENFFNIRPRHLFSTRVTRIRDKLRKPTFAPLKIRWQNASKF
jgi:hypothetical protein